MNVEDILSRSKEFQVTLLDRELILSFILKKPREFILSHPEYEVSEEEQEKFWQLLERRSQGEPVAYLTGRKEFYGLEFKVNKNVLIPRPETELMVEKVLEEAEELKGKEKAVFVDIGTGSGCVAISLAKVLSNLLSNKFISATRSRALGILRGNSLFLATDISKKALDVARENAKKNEVENIEFFQGDLLDPIIENEKFKEVDQILITANLPYLSQELYQNSPKDVQDYEPKIALESGADGLDHYRKLLEQLVRTIVRTKVRTSLFLEISPEQAEEIQDLIKNLFSEAKIDVYKDLAGKNRVVRAILGKQ